jgi:diamine N-acetyltransferase
MDGWILRRAGAADAARLAELGLATFRETFVEEFAIPYPVEDLQAFTAASYAPSVFAGKLADPAQATWIVERGDEALAYANAGPCTLPHPEVAAGELELSRLYVRRAAQGAGVGRRLLDTALAWMAAQHAGAQWIGVWSGNLKAQRLYAGYGFRKAGEYEFPVGRWRDREFILRRP